MYNKIFCYLLLVLRCWEAVFILELHSAETQDAIPTIVYKIFSHYLNKIHKKQFLRLFRKEQIIYNALKLTKKISKSHNEILKWFVDLKTAQTFVLAICKKDSYTYISFWTIYLKIELADGFATILNYLNVIPPAQSCAED